MSLNGQSDSGATMVRSPGTCTDALSAGEPPPQKEAEDSQPSEIALKKERFVDALLDDEGFTIKFNLFVALRGVSSPHNLN